jgi:hypothetical protein
MYFCKGKSKCVHVGPECKRSRVKNATLVEFDPQRMRKCKFCCVDSVCYVCLEEVADVTNSECGNHDICHDCLHRNVEVCSRAKGWDHKILCPCGIAFDENKFPLDVKQVIDRLRTENHELNSMYRKFHYDVVVQDLLTLKCPNCQIAFLDFDGCLAIKCNCGKYFCAKCMRKCEDDKEAHTHVLVCHGEYYMSAHDWERHIHNFKCGRTIRYVVDTMVETNSAMYGIILCLMLDKYDHCILPSSLKGKYITPLFKFMIMNWILYFPILTMCVLFVLPQFLKLLTKSKMWKTAI